MKIFLTLHKGVPELMSDIMRVKVISKYNQRIYRLVDVYRTQIK